MAIDAWNRCQVACKIVNLIKPKGTNVGAEQAGMNYRPDWQAKLWREVEILKYISHVRSPMSS